jgi:hypothetical protein
MWSRLPDFAALVIGRLWRHDAEDRPRRQPAHFHLSPEKSSPPKRTEAGRVKEWNFADWVIPGSRPRPPLAHGERGFIRRAAASGGAAGRTAARPARDQEEERRIAHEQLQQKRPGDREEVTISATVPGSRNEPGLEQHIARRRHGQEEGEIDRDRMLTGIAQQVEETHLGEQCRERDHRSGADEAHHQRNSGYECETGDHHQAVDRGPDQEGGDRELRMLLRQAREREEMRAEPITGVEIDEAGGELVHERISGLDPERLERDGGEEDEQWRRSARELGHDEKGRQQIDEPERAERIDEGVEIKLHDAERAHFAREPGRLEADLDGEPQHVEVDEMQNATIEIARPVAIDDAGQEQARDQEEVGHAERLGEIGDCMHPVLLSGRELDAEGRVHRHHHDDAEALGVIDPVDAFRAFDRRLHFRLRIRRLSQTGTDTALRPCRRKRRAGTSFTLCLWPAMRGRRDDPSMRR